MSIPAVSNLSIFQELQSFYRDRRTDLKQLGSALQAGDLNQAQQVYDTLAALGQSGPFSNSEPFSSTSRAKAFDAIGQALQSGDLAGAQAAFATLLQSQGAQSSGAHLLPAFLVSLRTAQNAGAESAPAAESIYQQEQDFRQQRKTDIEQLGQALQSGNADAAQQAYNALVALGQNSPFSNSQPFRRADRAQDFTAIGQALQAGDLAGAQQAFTDLASTFGNHQIPLGPPTPLPSPTTLPPGPPTPVLPPATLPSEIVINVGGSAAPSGNASEIVLNLAKPSSNYQFVLNLIDTGSNSPAQNSSLSLQA